MKRGGRVRFKLAYGMVIGCLLAGVLSGCTSARSSLGTSDSTCFLSLAPAADAVGDHGHLVGIRLFTPGQLAGLAPKLEHQLAMSRLTAPHMCVAAYEGIYTSAMVTKPVGRARGTLAVVVVNASSHQVIATVIIKKPPLNFGHTH